MGLSILVKKYEEAKKQGLNWQALLIEETQSEIKALILKMVLSQKSWFEINRAVVDLVQKTIKELENKALKETAEKSLYIYATKVYNYTRQTFQEVDWFVLTALSSVATNVASASVNQIQAVKQL